MTPMKRDMNRFKPLPSDTPPPLTRNQAADEAWREYAIDQGHRGPDNGSIERMVTYEEPH